MIVTLAAATVLVVAMAAAARLAAFVLVLLLELIPGVAYSPERERERSETVTRRLGPPQIGGLDRERFRSLVLELPEPDPHPLQTRRLRLEAAGGTR